MSELRERFWERYSLKELRRAEWEALCDGCGKCCLHKLEDEETGRIFRTNVACRLLDLDTCRCGNYALRRQLVAGCVTLGQENIEEVLRTALGIDLPRSALMPANDRLLPAPGLLSTA